MVKTRATKKLNNESGDIPTHPDEEEVGEELAVSPTPVVGTSDLLQEQRNPALPPHFDPNLFLHGSPQGRAAARPPGHNNDDSSSLETPHRF
jgi:hypothetical protein